MDEVAEQLNNVYIMNITGQLEEVEAYYKMLEIIVDKIAGIEHVIPKGATS